MGRIQDKTSFLEQVHELRRLLSLDIYRTQALESPPAYAGNTRGSDPRVCEGKVLGADVPRSDSVIQIAEASRAAQRFLCKAIISQMLASKGIPDAGYCALDTGYERQLPGSDGIVSRIQEEIAGMDLSAFPFEILSDIHESYLTRKLILNNAGELEYLPEGRLKKGKGIYYTPGYIVRHIVDWTLGRYLWGIENGRSSGSMPVKVPEDIRNLRILDPACGSGSFLAYVFDVLAEFYSLYYPNYEFDWLSTILGEHLYGIDMDREAVQTTSAILTLKALERGHAPHKTLKLNIRQGNFLISDPSADRDLKPFNWEKETPEVLSEGGFMMILGNPPYGAKLTKTERKLIRACYETNSSSDSSSLFIEKAVKMLRDDGFLGFIVPKSLSYVVSWQPIRTLLLKECKIVKMADARKAFRGVHLEQMIIIAHKHCYNNVQTVVSILRPEYSLDSHSIDSSALNAVRFSIWLSNRGIKDIVDRIWEISTPLGHLAEIWSGLNIQRLPIFSDRPDSEYSHPCLRGRDIQRYHIRKEVKYVKTSYAIKSQRLSLKTFYRPKIIAQDIVAHIQKPRPHIKIMATIDRFGDSLNVNTVTNIATTEYHLEYLCAILNSHFISWYAYNFIYNRAIRTMHFRPGYADHIPIRRIDPNDCQSERIYWQLVDHVNQIMFFYEKRSAAKNKIAELDTKIEELIYKLYGITSDDVRFLRQHTELY